MTATRVDPSETAAVFSAARAQAGRDEPELIGNVLDAALKYKKVENFTTFLAEYTLLDGNIVVHFFPPKEAWEGSLHNGQPRVSAEFMRGWKRTFPAILSPLAESYFKATMPVLQATYVGEMHSWWFRAGGFANGMDPDGLILAFFAQLDAALDAA